MVEQKVAIVPRIVVNGALGPKEYGLLLTDQRMIFVLEKSSKAGLGAVLGGAVGALIAEAATKKQEFVYADSDPETLAKLDKNIAIQNSSVRRIRIKRKLGGACSARLEYTDAQGKDRKIEGLLTPPNDQISARRAGGEKLNDIIKDYATKSQTAFKMVLPISAAQESEWLS